MYLGLAQNILAGIIPASKWSTTMVRKSPSWGWFPFPMAFAWLINPGDPNHLHPLG